MKIVQKNGRDTGQHKGVPETSEQSKASFETRLIDVGQMAVSDWLLHSTLEFAWTRAPSIKHQFENPLLISKTYLKWWLSKQ